MASPAEKLCFEFGCDPADFEGYAFQEGRIGAFLELHIEQGPVLESLDAADWHRERNLRSIMAHSGDDRLRWSRGFGADADAT